MFRKEKKEKSKVLGYQNSIQIIRFLQFYKLVLRENNIFIKKYADLRLFKFDKGTVFGVDINSIVYIKKFIECSWN